MLHGAVPDTAGVCIAFGAFSEYLALKQKQSERDYFKQLSDQYAYQSQQPGFIPQIKVRSQTFERIFGSENIDIKAKY